MKSATALAVAAAIVVCCWPLAACHRLLPFGRTAAPSADAASDGVGRHDSRLDLIPAPRSWKTVATTSPMGKVMGAKMTYCGGMLLFGGRNEQQQLVSGLWELGADNKWTEKAQGDLSRYAPAVVCDEQLGALLVFGGQNASGEPQNDLWRWDSSSSWRQITTLGSAPAARFASFSAYDGLRHKTVVFGGISAGVTTDELWELDSQSWTWTRGTTSGSWPSARHSEGSSAVFVSDGNAPAQLRNRFVIVGGTREVSSNSPVVLGDTWAWDGKSWTEVCSTCLSPARSHAAVVYDQRNRELLSITGWKGGELAGTWRWVVTDWEKIDDLLPSARDTSAVAYDPGPDRIVLFGGNGVPCGDPTGNCGDTLIYQ